MSGSNIYMRLVTAGGPVIGEGLLEGWEGAVELQEFQWGMHALKDPKKRSLGAAIAGAAASMVGLSKPVTIKMEPLTFVKRFDVASSAIHTALDLHLPVVSCAITVLHIKQGGRAIHEPGFVLTANNGYFADVSIDVVNSSNAAELVETVRLNFKQISITYLKRLGKDNVPTAPFVHPLLPI